MTAGSPSAAPVGFACDPDTENCKDQIMAREQRWVSEACSGHVSMEITIQKLKKIGQNLAVPDAVNFYDGDVTFDARPRFHTRKKIVHWKPFFFGFDLRGFAEMCFLDPYEFNGTNYELHFNGSKELVGRLCWVFGVTPKQHAKGWHFKGTIRVLPDDLTIIGAKGAYHPMRKIIWVLLAEDHWYCFESWRKEASAGTWVPDFTCTGAKVVASDFTNPPFQARVIFVFEARDKARTRSTNACGMESTQFPTRLMQSEPNSRLIHK